ncbi:L,D-transpeptidase [Pseudonocardia hydrocarbonoxydans]|uniref:L,D-transpeptidase n=1 Tax=Pseudonocardia hydrocarbonoxydans TaxID=76726 RepID=UPI0031D0924A
MVERTRRWSTRTRRIRHGAVCAVAVAVGVLALNAPALAAQEPTGPTVAGTPCTASARACVDLAAGTAWLISDGAVTYGPVPVAQGRDGAETPRGTTVVDWKSRYHHSREYNGAAMHYAVFFAPGGIAFHEGDLSDPSAGCLRLATEAASRFFDTLAVGDEVQVR